MSPGPNQMKLQRETGGQQRGPDFLGEPCVPGEPWTLPAVAGTHLQVADAGRNSTWALPLLVCLPALGNALQFSPPVAVAMRFARLHRGCRCAREAIAGPRGLRAVDLGLCPAPGPFRGAPPAQQGEGQLGTQSNKPLGSNISGGSPTATRRRQRARLLSLGLGQPQLKQQQMQRPWDSNKFGILEDHRESSVTEAQGVEGVAGALGPGHVAGLLYSVGTT